MINTKNASMTLEEINALKKDMEAKIQSLIIGFYKQTHIDVTGITVHTAELGSGVSSLLAVRVDINPFA